jgi:hypothetical protein
MISRLRIALFLPLAALLACASSGNPPSGTNFATTAGDYVITVGTGTASAATLTGNLAVAGSNVSGVMRYNIGSQCVPASQDIAFTGTDANGLVTLNSTAFAGSVATLTIQLPLLGYSGGQQIANGTAVIAGGSCARASTPLQAQLIPTFTGTWTGTLSGPDTGPASVIISESGPNSDGQFPATASVTFTATGKSACSFSIPGSAPIAEIVSGSTMQTVDSNAPITITANASSSPVTFTVSLNGTGSTQACQGTYTGTLSH